MAQGNPLQPKALEMSSEECWAVLCCDVLLEGPSIEFLIFGTLLDMAPAAYGIVQHDL